MRVVLVCERFDANGGGLEQWTCQVARRLVARGHDLHVLTFKVGETNHESAAGVHRLPWHSNRLARAGAVDTAVAALGADVVHDTGVGWSYDVLQPQAGSRIANHRQDMRSRTRRERFANRVRPRYWRWLYEARALERRQYARRDGIVVAVSAMVAEHLRELHGVAPERLRLVPNGVDTERFTPPRVAACREATRRRLGAGDGDTVFLFAAHNPRLKGIRPLLDAMRIVRQARPKSVLMTIGRESDAVLRRAVARHALERAVICLGVVDDPALYYAAADVFVLPTFYDACSLTVLEACACGLPVITTRRNGASELVTSGADGFVVDEPDDRATLAEYMIRLTDPNLRKPMAEAARALALRNSLDRNVDALETIYDDVVAKRGEATGRA